MTLGIAAHCFTGVTFALVKLEVTAMQNPLVSAQLAVFR
jgi:hypothetical protein